MSGRSGSRVCAPTTQDCRKLLGAYSGLLTDAEMDQLHVVLDGIASIICKELGRRIREASDIKKALKDFTG